MQRQLTVMFRGSFERAIHDNQHKLLSSAIGTELQDTLRSQGADTLHFCSLNRLELRRDIFLALTLYAKSSIKAFA